MLAQQSSDWGLGSFLEKERVGMEHEDLACWDIFNGGLACIPRTLSLLFKVFGVRTCPSYDSLVAAIIGRARDRDSPLSIFVTTGKAGVKI